MNNDEKTHKHIKSKQRVVDHGEVFTNPREVNAMLDLVKQETERIDSRFLEPACGNGNFLIEILNRKLNVIDKLYSNSQEDWERNVILAFCNIYGIDILKENVEESRKRLFTLFKDRYASLFKVKLKVLQNIDFILRRNILWGNTLEYIDLETNDLIAFSEWTFSDKEHIKRCDFVFKYLVEKPKRITLLIENDKTVNSDGLLKEYAPIYYLDLGR